VTTKKVVNFLEEKVTPPLKNSAGAHDHRQKISYENLYLNDPG